MRLTSDFAQEPYPCNILKLWPRSCDKSKDVYKRQLLVATFLSAETIFAADAAIDDSIAPCAHETPEQHDARMAWWRDARFGLFIHWGVYSVSAGTYEGKRIDGIGEWIMNHGKIPMAKYQAYAKEFDPTNFNAVQWVKLAKAAQNPEPTKAPMVTNVTGTPEICAVVGLWPIAYIHRPITVRDRI